MSFKKPWSVGNNNPSTEPVPVLIDGQVVGTAKKAVTRAYVGSGRGIDDVELFEFEGISNTAFYGQINRELRKENNDLKDKVSELQDQVDKYTWAPIAHIQHKYDLAVRDKGIEELEAEVERLKESRKEQAEKHKQKLRNIQQNFEQRKEAKTRNTQLKKQLETAEMNARYFRKQEDDRRADIERLRKQIDEQATTIESLEKQIANMAGEGPESRVSDGQYWHEMYLTSEAVIAEFAQGRKKLVDTIIDLQSDLSKARRGSESLVDHYNRLNNEVNEFMDAFSAGAIVINDAVDAWNATVTE